MPDIEANYNKLNKEQRKAVDTIDGPVLVVAGPGTGKTQLLSMRAANILRQTDTNPDNILCLTFTNKAAINMKERLHSLIGADSRNITVKTFHGLAAEIMNRYPEYFWQGAKLSVAPDVVADDILTDILSALPHDNPLTSQFAGSFTAIADIKQAMQLAKENGLTPAQLRRAVAANISHLEKLEPKLVRIIPDRLSAKALPKLAADIQSIPAQHTNDLQGVKPLHQVIIDSFAIALEQDTDTNKTKHVGKWKQKWLQTIDGKPTMAKEHKKNQWWLAVSEVYQKYRGEMHTRGYYDYADMLVEVLSQLSTHADLRADLQEQYQFVMIDEFQDTNAAQLKLADLITNHPATNNRPNIMVVGDDDQAIFTFQGAEISNVTQFINNYDAVEVVVLKENYRSTNRVLDSAQEIILLSSSRLVDQVEGLSKELTANTPNIDSEILRLTYPTVEHQCSDVAQRIAQLWNNGQKHIAVLARKHSSLEAIASSLQQQQVPLRYERKNNILDQEAIEQILLIANAATAIASGDQKNLNVYLSRLLRHPMWKIPASTLWKLAIDNYSKPDWLSSVVEHSDPRLNELADWLSNMARRTNSMPLPRVIDNIIGLSSDYSYTSPVREHFLVGQENTHEYMNMLSGLSVLRHVTREFAGHKATLEDFVRFVDLNKQTKKPVTNSSWYQSSSDAVDLLTVHGAKGLEFDTVFVIDTIDDHWRPRKSSRAAPSNFVMQPYGENPDDYVRLLYVAATRAKKKLYFTNPEADDTGKQLLSSPLVPELETIAEPSTPLDSVEVLEDKLRWPRLSETSEKNLLANSLDTFSLSASSLLDFLDVTEAGPQSFKERWLLRIPREQSTAGSFGNAIHGALQTAQRLINESGFSINPVLDRFESELDRQFLPEHELARLTSKGEALLRSVLANPEALLPVGAKAELKLETTLPLGANIKGSIDQLLVTANEVIVADYKTGRPLSSLTTQNKQQAHKAWKHKTQLLFYALLVSKQRQFRGKTITTKLVYLENDGKKPKVIEYSPTKDELNVLEELIETIWPLIRNFDLPDTESYAKTLEGVLLFEKDLLEGKYHGKKHKQ